MKTESERLELARNIFNDSNTNEETRELLQKIFPDENLEYEIKVLEKEEDIDIANLIIDIVNDIDDICFKHGPESLFGFKWNFNDTPRIIDWLSKHKNPTGEEINPSEFDLRVNMLLKQFETLDKKEILDTLDFYANAIRNLDNVKAGKSVKPKFNEKDWIVDLNGNLYNVEQVTDKRYLLKDKDNHTIEKTINATDYSMHLWTIDDAKPGDILASREWIVILDKLTCNKNIVSKLAYYTFNPTMMIANDKEPFLSHLFKPATASEKKKLFDMMDKKGYVFIADSCTVVSKKEQKPSSDATDEDDDLMFNAIVFTFQDIYQHIGRDYVLFENKKIDHHRIINWLERKFIQNSNDTSDEDDDLMYNAIVFTFQENYKHLGIDYVFFENKKINHHRIINWLKRKYKQINQNNTSIDKHSFNIENWIIGPDGKAYYIREIVDDEYHAEDSDGHLKAIKFSVEHLYHEWTYKDAKPGDILKGIGDCYIVFKDYYNTYNPHLISFCNCTNNFFNKNEDDGWCADAFRPATLEQKIFMLDEMKKADYAIPKACSDILTYTKSAKITSTAEDVPENSNMLDEDALDIAIRIIENNGNDCAGILDKEWALNWLKSLNPNSCCWKPSQQQISTLNKISQSLNESKELIDAFIEQLPK